MSEPIATDHYWLADDGRLFGSARAGLVAGKPSADAAFVAWSALGRLPSRWPPDEKGQQTDASLVAMLAPFGLSYPGASLGIDALVAYAASVRFTIETAGVTVSGVEIATDLDSQSRIANAYAYLQASGLASVQFKATSGWITLTADQVKAIALAVGAHVQACFAAEDAADVAINATPPTITTRAQVDAAFAALRTTGPASA